MGNIERFDYSLHQVIEPLPPIDIDRLSFYRKLAEEGRLEKDHPGVKGPATGIFAGGVDISLLKSLRSLVEQGKAGNGIAGPSIGEYAGDMKPGEPVFVTSVEEPTI